jgi:membrane protease YdiL (CAAX protease family)
MCGAGLLLVAVLLSRFSKPAAAWVAARLLGSRVVQGVAIAALSVASAGAGLALIGWMLGSSVSLLAPRPQGPLLVVLVGQLLIALAEETYYRGLLLGELLRLGPRLGLSSPVSRRWVALALTSLLFGIEHLGGFSGWDDASHQVVFALALGALLGMIVLLTDNLWLAATLHAWINWLLLRAIPEFAYGPARASLPPGASVSLVLIAAFLAAFALQRRRGLGARIYARSGWILSPVAASLIAGLELAARPSPCRGSRRPPLAALPARPARARG